MKDVFGWLATTFNELLEKDGPVSIHHQNLQKSSS